MTEKDDKQAIWQRKAEEEGAKTLTELAFRWLGNGFDWGKNEMAFRAATHNYIRRWLNRWGIIKPLGADAPIPLREIFVQVQAVPRSTLQRFRSVDEMEAEIANEHIHRLFPSWDAGKPQSGFVVANRHSRLNLLGAPGSGKSTFLRRLGLESLLPKEGVFDLRRQYEHEVLPVLLELRALREGPVDLMAALSDELQVCGFPEARFILKRLLENGNLLIMLDGVDEIPGKRLDDCISAIGDFTSRYLKNRFVLSCRTAFYRDWFTHFSDFVLADFDQGQIQAFATNWFTRVDEVRTNAAQCFLDLINTEDHRSTRELAGTPLLLTFLCLTFRRDQRLPSNRAQLYKRALDILLTEWAASKRVHNNPIYTDLSPEMEVQMLAEVAGSSFEQNRYVFRTEELTLKIQAFLANELKAPKSLSPNDILDAIAVQQGLLVERAQDAWTFSHLTIQEYLAAVFFTTNSDIVRVIQAHGTDDRWKEVLVLSAGLGKADDLLEGLMAKAEELPREAQALESLLEFVNRKVGEKTPREDAAAVRLLCLGTALRFASVLTLDRDFVRDLATLSRTQDVATLNRASDLARDLANNLARDFASNLARDLDVARDRARDLDLESARVRDFALDFDRARDLARAFDRALDSDTESNIANSIISLLTQEIVSSLFDKNLSIERYLVLQTRIWDCKQAALRVSREKWKALCDRICRPTPA